jgi:hypothetical protein
MTAVPLHFPALHATHGGIWIASADGRVREIQRGEAIARAAETPMVLLNGPLVAARLGYGELSGLDLLELFAFVHPAHFAVPTPHGIAVALGMDSPVSDAEAAPFLIRSGPNARVPGHRPRPSSASAGRGPRASSNGSRAPRKQSDGYSPSCRSGTKRHRGRSRDRSC